MEYFNLTKHMQTGKTKYQVSLTNEPKENVLHFTHTRWSGESAMTFEEVAVTN
jgi:hypothetical protein